MPRRSVSWRKRRKKRNGVILVWLKFRVDTKTHRKVGFFWGFYLFSREIFIINILVVVLNLYPGLDFFLYSWKKRFKKIKISEKNLKKINPPKKTGWIGFKHKQQESILHSDNIRKNSNLCLKNLCFQIWIRIQVLKYPDSQHFF